MHLLLLPSRVGGEILSHLAIRALSAVADGLTFMQGIVWYMKGSSLGERKVPIAWHACHEGYECSNTTEENTRANDDTGEPMGATNYMKPEHVMIDYVKPCSTKVLYTNIVTVRSSTLNLRMKGHRCFVETREGFITYSIP